MIQPLTLDDAEFIAHAAVIELMNYDNEPVPPFNTREPGILESCLLEPFQTFDGQSLHPRFVEKAAIQFYLLIKNHPFRNGNKRMAVMLTLVFSFVNKRWMSIEARKLYDIACWVADSKPQEKDKVLAELETEFQKALLMSRSALFRALRSQR